MQSREVTTAGLVLSTLASRSQLRGKPRKRAAAHRELVDAHRWIIIGYSAPPSDRFFQYLLGSAKAENQHLETVAVFNYGQDEEERSRVRNRYERLFTPSFAQRRLQFFLEGRFPLDALDFIEGLVRPQ